MSVTPDLPNGTSIRVHAEYAMDRVEGFVRASFEQIRSSRKMKPEDRDRIQRELAGAIASLESIRLWLIAGAPQ